MKAGWTTLFLRRKTYWILILRGKMIRDWIKSFSTFFPHSDSAPDYAFVSALNPGTRKNRRREIKKEIIPCVFDRHRRDSSV